MDGNKRRDEERKELIALRRTIDHRLATWEEMLEVLKRVEAALSIIPPRYLEALRQARAAIAKAEGAA